jgi:NAD(P)-dependent dehydrogenase (short-subunit alcohol dehydrogenase family)
MTTAQEMTLKDKIALVTGAATGIGEAIAFRFAEFGATVVVSDVDPDRGGKTAYDIEQKGGRSLFVEADVADADAVEKLLQKTVEQYGRLDCAINNAGIEGTQAPTAECDEKNWHKVIAVNLTGTFLCTKHEIAQMLRQNGGSIINVSSVAGLVGFANLPAYVAAKHGIVGLTKTAALEYAPKGIRVNAICPGVIRTEMIDRITGDNPEKEKEFIALEPIGRMGRPEEVADAAVWLASDRSSFVTGHALEVGGGFTAR